MDASRKGEKLERTEENLVSWPLAFMKATAKVMWSHWALRYWVPRVSHVGILPRSAAISPATQLSGEKGAMGWMQIHPSSTKWWERLQLSFCSMKLLSGCFTCCSAKQWKRWRGQPWPQVTAVQPFVPCLQHFGPITASQWHLSWALYAHAWP